MTWGSFRFDFILVLETQYFTISVLQVVERSVFGPFVDSVQEVYQVIFFRVAAKHLGPETELHTQIVSEDVCPAVEDVALSKVEFIVVTKIEFRLQSFQIGIPIYKFPWGSASRKDSLNGWWPQVTWSSRSEHREPLSKQNIFSSANNIKKNCYRLIFVSGFTTIVDLRHMLFSFQVI